ncbi:hypothetical protein [Actinoplanes utahensis]|uniref:hypothetical protein n=1 Tax=Actinoplanes utahensis TaxID=1869 RepID=UPI00068A5463|nr:hypothetical protein [Actinoplanes utahensis]GIF29108.1 hypothetical protein Aut01nite_20940 [Actinoplanes utahensis]
MIEDEPLTWGVAANVSHDVFTRQRTDTKRPGTRHFVPGAKVWVLPTMWGDGGEQRYVVGTRRGTGGRRLIRLVMNTAYLVNFRVKPVHSPAVYAAMGQPGKHGRELPLYASREDAQRTADSWKWARTRLPHLGLGDETATMHDADETCEFCDGRDAAQAGAGADANPYAKPSGEPAGSVDWWGTSHGMWWCGWLTETNRGNVYRIDDLSALHIALARRRLRRRAEHTWLVSRPDERSPNSRTTASAATGSASSGAPTGPARSTGSSTPGSTTTIGSSAPRSADSPHTGTSRTRSPQSLRMSSTSEVNMTTGRR